LRHSRSYVEIRLFFKGVFQKRDLSKKEKSMVFETHCTVCHVHVLNSCYLTMLK